MKKYTLPTVKQAFCLKNCFQVFRKFKKKICFYIFIGCREWPAKMILNVAEANSEHHQVKLREF
jgi:hypothetical protein